MSVEDEAERDQESHNDVVRQRGGDDVRPQVGTGQGRLRDTAPIARPRYIEELGADGVLEDEREDREQHSSQDQRPDDDIELVAERTGALDLAVLLGAVRRPLQRSPRYGRDEERGQQAERR